jgi:drug/metabolite transporter (DMT)-like permease
VRFSPHLLLGVCAFAVSQITFVSATFYTSASTAVFLQYTAKIYIGIFGGYYLGEKATRSDWISAFIVILGMSVLLLHSEASSSSSDSIGIALGILCGFSYSWVLMALRRLKGVNSLHVMLLGNIVVLFAAAPFLSGVTLQQGVFLSSFGSVHIGLSWILLLSVIQHFRAMQFAIITSIGPVLNPVWVYAFTGEIPSPLEFLGAIVIFIGVLYSIVRGGKQSPSANSVKP